MLASMAKMLFVSAATAGITAASMHMNPQRSRR
jgi:hypothetical protein